MRTLLTATLVAATTLVVAAGGLVAAGPLPATAAGNPTCRDLDATIVGGPGDRVSGTAEADVIVATNSARVSAGGGNDTICYIGQGPINEIDAGDGDDYVDLAQAELASVSVKLGRGADLFVGGDSAEHVTTGNAFGDDAVDRVDTGAGKDQVSSGRDPVPNADVIDLGSGADALDFDGQPAPGLDLAGGGGVDAITGLADGTHVDLSREVIAGTGGGSGSLTSVEHVHGYHDLVVIGSDKAERVEASQGLDARMGGGDDRIEVAFGADVVVGGEGRDGLTLGIEPVGGDFGGRDLRVDLRSRVGWSNGVPFKIGVEDVALIGYQSVSLLGNAFANHLEVRSSCSVRIDGRAAGDRLHVVATDYCRTPDPRLNGGSGPDILLGSTVNDVLIGGRGRDRADGHRGRDRCVAEAERRCER